MGKKDNMEIEVMSMDCSKVQLGHISFFVKPSNFLARFLWRLLRFEGKMRWEELPKGEFFSASEKSK